ncbi:hypothetical protein EJV44_04545 [Ancylobacter aquaticus]|nr:hypothetical protein EJV44_04545 [Ancylobacter aquaticus]
MATESSKTVSIDLLEDEQTVRVDITFVDAEAAERFIRWFVTQLDTGTLTFGQSSAASESEVVQ